MRRIFICFFLLSILADDALHRLGASALSFSANANIASVDQIRTAMSLTTKGQFNITAAQSAVSTWSSILEGGSDITSTMQSQIRILCHSLYASSLSRIGNDQEALRIYNVALSLHNADSLEENAAIDIYIGRGEAHQRLMKYSTAREDFLTALKLIQGKGNLQGKRAKILQSAVICCLRQGDLSGAVLLLSDIFEGKSDLASIDSDIVGLYGAIRFELELRGHNFEGGVELSYGPLELLEHAATSNNISPVYQWFHAVAEKRSLNMFDIVNGDNEKFLQLAALNSPFDNPELLNLDDKILLHDMLNTKHRESNWPKGYVLPRDERLLQNHFEKYGESNWMVKERAGYGSHGNTIAKTQEALEISAQVKDSRSVLCQKLIEPSLLFNKRKFSIRVYVVYFNNGKEIVAYLLNIGLAKLAEEEYGEGLTSDETYMTNSGRIEGDSMTQYGLHDLQHYMDEQHGSKAYQTMWTSVKDSVSIVIKAFSDSIHASNQNDFSLFSTVPKILGFDYIIDPSYEPVLMEVNRFPGLEGRGKFDQKMKYQVVEMAWTLASIMRERNHRLDEGYLNRSVSSVKLNLAQKVFERKKME